MAFAPTGYDPASPTNVQHWVDDTGQWYLDVERVFFSYRVLLQQQLALYPYPEVVLNYCAGPHREWVEALVTVLRASLRELDPATTTPPIDPLSRLRHGVDGWRRPVLARAGSAQDHRPPLGLRFPTASPTLPQAVSQPIPGGPIRQAL